MQPIVGIVILIAGIAGVIICVRKKYHWTFFVLPVVFLFFGLGVLGQVVFYDPTVTNIIVIVTTSAGLLIWLVWYLIIPLYNRWRDRGTFEVYLEYEYWKKGDLVKYNDRKDGIKNLIVVRKVEDKRGKWGGTKYRVKEDKK